ncbi:hypothetical protein QDA08_gp18 [Microbacterium phage NoodlelyBoi]|uniref:Uncharacterized protein n=1 Tax=Microbacterium phage NoodlelyBoi TaxID=2813165 RepID=A0A899IRV3_9CAUD|nr:hypothetical protein QDA08_gp18 [Microbacterium phage NoodlelyBoi]QSM01213.1 hypothetical protein SEA_NOODLELYBOI_18 [Microbacterium phage NoodlelyBoi]
MRFLAGWITGLATAWAALAIWRRVPPFPDIEPEDEPWPPPVEVDREAFTRPELL